MPTAKCCQWTSDIRQSTAAYFAGNNMTGASVRYAGDLSITTINSTNQKAEIKAAIDGGYDATNPTTVNWATTGVAAQAITVKNDNLMKATIINERGAGETTPDYRSYCCPFIIRNASGDSPTYVLNRPKVFGFAGADPSKLYYNTLYSIVGEHLACTAVPPSVWLWDGTTPVDTTKLYNCPLVEPAGQGTGNTRDDQRTALFFEIPSSVPSGAYKLIVFTNENRYGMSSSTAVPVTVMGTKNPWNVNPVIKTDLASTVSGTDITQALMEVLFNAAFNASPATEAAPWLIKLPPGVFYISHIIPWPANTGLVGAGIEATRVIVNPALAGCANSAGSFYYDVGSYGTANSCYGGQINGINRIAGIFSGDQRASSREVMIRIRGSNTLFRDLNFEPSPDKWQTTAFSIIGAIGSINRGNFERVKFYSQIATTQFSLYGYGAIYRFGLWKYWNFTNCEFECQIAFEGTDGILNGFPANGSFDNGLVMGGSYKSVYGRSTDSHLGSCFGRACLIYGVDVSRTRRGIALKAGSGSMESAIMCCAFDNMLSELGNGEVILHENRTSAFVIGGSHSSTTVVLPGDSDDRTRWTAIVLHGTGRYQFRVIASSSGATHTLETPWEITPDTNSIIILTQCPTRCAYINNRVVNAIGGFTFFGSAVGCVLNSNYLNGSKEGILLNTNWDTPSTNNQNGDVGYQYGDGRSVSLWHSMRSNMFEDGSGHQFVAARTTYDLAIFTFPQIAFITTAYNTYFGDVVNQLYACEGLEGFTKGDENGANLANVNLIDWINSAYDNSYTSPRYLHGIIAKTLLLHNVWFTSLRGIGAFEMGGHRVDDIVVNNMADLVSTSANANGTGRYSMNQLLADPGGNTNLGGIIGDIIGGL